MRVENLISGHLSLQRLENELSSWLAIWSGHLCGIVFIHGPHELVTTSFFHIKLFGNSPSVASKMFETIKFVPASRVTRVRMFFVPLSSDWLLELKGLCSGSEKCNESEIFHF